VPIAGGSVKYGNYLTETSDTTVTASTWTTIKAFTSDEMAGVGELRKSYSYTVRAGRADKTTGFDSGRVLNAVAYSDTGTLPTWLRMSGNNLQANLAQTTYGLDVRVTLFYAFPSEV